MMFGLSDNFPGSSHKANVGWTNITDNNGKNDFSFIFILNLNEYDILVSLQQTLISERHTLPDCPGFFPACFGILARAVAGYRGTLPVVTRNRHFAREAGITRTEVLPPPE